MGWYGKTRLCLSAQLSASAGLTASHPAATGVSARASRVPPAPTVPHRTPCASVARDPLSAPGGLQPLPQACQAGHQLPAALLCQAMGPTELDSCPGPASACPCPQEVPDGWPWGCPCAPRLLSPGWGGGRALAARACLDRRPRAAPSPHSPHVFFASHRFLETVNNMLLSCAALNSFANILTFWGVFSRTAAPKAQIITLSKRNQDWYETESSFVH